MTLNRRSFLQAGMGVGIGVAGGGSCQRGQAAYREAPIRSAGGPVTEYERILATANLFNSLGRPRSWALVQQGFLPISPERVLVLQPRDLARLPDRWHDEKCQIRDRMQADADQERMNPKPNGHRRHAFENGISSEKLGLILWLTRELTQYYAAPEWWREWAYNMTFRESLGSTSLGRHGAMPHQYQYDAKTYATTPINTVNAGVDWWLVLIPGGTADWEAFDHLPVHAMVTYVLAGLPSDGPGNRFRIEAYCEWVIRGFAWDSPNAFVELAKMDRASAARRMNQHIVPAVYGFENRERERSASRRGPQ